MKKVSVIGAGALATIFVTQLDRLLKNEYEISCIYSKTLEHAQTLANKVQAQSTDSFDEFQKVPCDIVVEFAGINAVKLHAKALLEDGKDLIIASAGALADEVFKEELQKAAKGSGSKLYVAGGAIGGLDLMQTFALMGEAEAEICSTKAPRSLNGAPYLQGRLLSETEREIVFEGGVKEAIAGFPKNVNVAVTTSAATENPATQVKLISTPGTSTNTHTITLKNALMTAKIEIASQPDPKNPKSSVSTAWSALALLKNLASPIVYY